MKTFWSLASLALMGAAMGWQPESGAQPKEDGLEVLTRGPIHEAFAQPTAAKPAAPKIVAKKPPEPINELPPEQKPEGEIVQWIPGYWAFDEDRADFLWVSGIWRVPPPDRHWVPGYWQQAEGGYRWIAGYWAVRAEDTVELLPAPPEQVQEAIPAPPDADSVFVPGVWVYRENRYWWRPGHWVPGRLGWVWHPAHYCWTPGGYVFVAGFWDYDIDHRGIIFAPIVVDSRFIGRAGWTYRPRHVIGADFLIGSLFVHVGANRYFFGDYYDPVYARRGYTPWIDVRLGSTAFDPLFGYYRWQNRKNARWETDLRAQFVDRRDNPGSRPPRTLTADAKQQVAVPLDKWNGATFKLEALPKAQQDEILKHTERWRTFSNQRSKMETSVKPGAPSIKLPTPTIKIEMPKTPIRPPETKKAPPLPDVPKVLPKPPETKKLPDVPKVLPKPPPPKEKGKEKKKDKAFDGAGLNAALVARNEMLMEAAPWKSAEQVRQGQAWTTKEHGTRPDRRSVGGVIPGQRSIVLDAAANRAAAQ